MNRRTIVSLGVLLALASSCILSGCRPSGEPREASTKSATTKAKEGPLVVTSTESGTLESKEKTVIANELEWSVIIKSVKEEGELVKQGELVVEFECKELIDAIEDKELEIENAQMDLEQARKKRTMATKDNQNLVVQSENALKTAGENKARYTKESKSDVAKAEEVVKLAEEALARYLNKGGKWENDQKDADTAIELDRAQLALEEEKLAFKKKVNSNPELESPYSDTELERDEITVEQLKDKLQKSIAAKELLIKYDHPNQKRQLEEDVKQAKLDLSILVDYAIPQEMRLRDAAVTQARLALDKAKINQEAGLKWSEIEIKGKEKVLRKKQEKLEELLEQKEKLTVTAERDGLVIYNVTRGEHGVVIQIKEGAKINPRQRLIEIPDMTTLQVKTIIFESKNRYVRIKDEGHPGTEALVTLDSLPNRELQGRVVRKSTLPKIHGHDWMRTGARVYELYLDVDWNSAGLLVGQQLKPGMKCNVDVILERIDDALLIPITAVYSKGDRYYCTGIVDGRGVEREIMIGKMNDRYVQVLSGLEPGDVVLTEMLPGLTGGSTTGSSEGAM